VRARAYPGTMSLFGLDLHGKLDRIYELLEKIMTAQDDINTAVAQLAQTQANEANAVTVLQADVTAIQAELAGAGTPVDTTALNAAVAAQVASDNALASAVGDVTALVPPATAGGSPA
jgi:hypothetical protein